MSNLITYSIKTDEKIEVIRFSEDENIKRYEEVSIIYKDSDKEYILYTNDFIIEALLALQNLLIKAINGELELHSSLVEKGIGFLSNENFQNSQGLVMIKGKEGEFWVGDKYLLWDSMNHQTWIYNLNGEVAIEVTPTYKWHFEEPDKQSDEYLAYEDFRKNYKTCFIKTITKNVAECWLSQCEDILKRLI
jgi:NAD+--asparagine ADP-ribosyltransferase